VSQGARAEAPSRSPSLRSRIPVRSLAASAVVAGPVAAGAAVPAEAATTCSAPLRTAVGALPVAAESNTGYDRDRYFGDWRDTDRDCQNTRSEVLQAESRVRTAFTTARGCTVRSGRWVTTWDDRTHCSASAVQIDHTVPVHEAWGSGARNWTQARRAAFYDDLGDSRTLSARTSSLNSSKGARGPEQWMPPRSPCTYVGQWVAVRIRWGLEVDSAEKAALTRLAGSCADVTISVARA